MPMLIRVLVWSNGAVVLTFAVLGSPFLWLKIVMDLPLGFASLVMSGLLPGFALTVFLVLGVLLPGALNT